jgi:hypothetical protein
LEQRNRRRRAASRPQRTLYRRLPFAVAALSLLLAAPAGAGKLVQVRIGNHPGYTRVVFEFDAPTGYRLERRAAGESENTIVVTLQATSRARSIASKSRAVESVTVESVAGEAVARIVTREHGLPIKEMILTDPPRVVLDLMLPSRAKSLAAAKPPPKPAAAEPPPKPAAAEPPPKPAAAEPPPKPTVAPTEVEEVVAESMPTPVAVTAPEVEAPIVAAPSLPDGAEGIEFAAEESELVAEPLTSADDDPLWAESFPGTDLDGAVAPAEPAPLAVEPIAKKPAAVKPSAATDSSKSSDFGPLTLGAIAAGAFALLLVVFAVLRGRRTLPNDMDVTALAEAGADGEDQRAPAAGFAMDAPSGGTSDTAEDFENSSIEELGDENKPIESAQAAVPGAGLFDDSLNKKDPTTMQEQDMSMTQGASEAQTQLGVRAGLTGMAGDSNVTSLVQELERRMTQMEQRLDEANEARERLERQVSAQSEELRVQRAAIARTQRALRSLNRSEEDQATEPALRDPANSAGRQ